MSAGNLSLSLWTALSSERTWKTSVRRSGERSGRAWKMPGNRGPWEMLIIDVHAYIAKHGALLSTQWMSYEALHGPYTATCDTPDRHQFQLRQVSSCACVQDIPYHSSLKYHYRQGRDSPVFLPVLLYCCYNLSHPPMALKPTTIPLLREGPMSTSALARYSANPLDSPVTPVWSPRRSEVTNLHQ